MSQLSHYVAVCDREWSSRLGCEQRDADLTAAGVLPGITRLHSRDKVILFFYKNEYVLPPA